MANKGNRIDFKVGFTLDKNGLNELQREMEKVMAAARNLSGGKEATGQFKEAYAAASKLYDLLQSS